MAWRRAARRGCGHLTAIAALSLILAVPSVARAAAPLPSLTITPDLVLGGPDVEEDYIFDSISSVVEDSRGNLYVMDAKAPALYRFDPDGVLLATLTAAGEGPGDLVNFGTIAIDARDRIHVAGNGGRVQVLTPELRHDSSFERALPALFARSLAVFPDGTLAVAAIDPERHTTIHLFAAGGAHLRSFCDSFGAGRNLPPHGERTYGGGMLAAAPGERLLYVQLAPYLVRILDLTGKVLRQTEAGGADFVTEPEIPEWKDGRLTFRFSSMSTGIAPLPDGRILVSAMQRDDAGNARSLLCLYDAALNLLARHQQDGLLIVAGHGSGGRVFFTDRGEEGTRVLRARVAVAPGGR